MTKSTENPDTCCQQQELQALPTLSTQKTSTLALQQTTLNDQEEKNSQTQQSNITLFRPWWAYLFVAGYIFLGGIDTAVYKYQNSTVVDGQKFTHAFIQNYIMFLGMSLNLVMYFYNKYTGKINLEIDPSKKNMDTLKSTMILNIPAFLDMIGSLLQLFALNFIDNSIYMMIRGGSIIFACVFTKLFFKRKLLNYRYFGIFFVFVGLFIVGLSSFLNTKGKSQSDIQMQIISMVLLLLGIISDGAQYTTEEYVYSKFNVHPQFMLGLQAFYGSLQQMVLVAIACHVQCPFPNNEGCSKIYGVYWLESITMYFREIGKDDALLAMCIIGIFTKQIYNLCGTSITYYFSSVTRTVSGALRTLVVWVISLIVTATSSRKWETLDPISNVVKTIGFLVLVFGNLSYNGIIKIPGFPREQDLPKPAALTTVKTEEAQILKISPLKIQSQESQ
ncbi:nucleotide-sugar transporter (macronuclear) [Tetrahymena thermophila SB210]|uniref:Nucleotide-sugar transporter n=1 Tax=Tetrahymena thermophila (strain SB210) TaxID=312017 RepID=Q22B27_TETTS|nr:nucleotide-sugar transporter [Tetrahymena thermophila SB210]EAR82481.1 nucleotide-sugar transporter [Tetrahymena thermophila SB210]|eukprot:XP_001030144.1 nucleotide-sugar transporter [Tetrahymena thermophila SB210]